MRVKMGRPDGISMILAIPDWPGCGDGATIRDAAPRASPAAARVQARDRRICTRFCRCRTADWRGLPTDLVRHCESAGDVGAAHRRKHPVRARHV